MHFFFAILCCISYFLETSKRRNVFIIEWWCNYSTSRFQFQGKRKIRRLLPSQKYLKLKIFSRVNQSNKNIKNQEEENKGKHQVFFLRSYWLVDWGLVFDAITQVLDGLDTLTHNGFILTYVCTLFKNYSICRIWNLTFSTNFCPIKTDLSDNSVWPQAADFQNLSKWIIFGIFD